MDNEHAGWRLAILGCAGLMAMGQPASAQSTDASPDASARMSALKQQLDDQTKRLDELRRALADQEAVLRQLRRAIGNEALSQQRGGTGEPAPTSVAQPAPTPVGQPAPATVAQAASPAPGSRSWMSWASTTR